jgi:glycosyltransferase involved in cell wall biosynthesis
MIFNYLIILLLVCYGWLIIYYWLAWKSIPDYVPSGKEPQIKISVIIPARNEEENIGNLLAALEQQTYPSDLFEIIVVDDNSFDDTKYLLEEFRKSFKQMQVVELKQEAKLIPGKKFPLSIGIKTAKYEIMLLTDADCVPATEFWIDKMQETFDDNTEIVLGYGAYNKKPGLLNVL